MPVKSSPPGGLFIFWEHHNFIVLLPALNPPNLSYLTGTELFELVLSCDIL